MWKAQTAHGKIHTQRSLCAVDVWSGSCAPAILYLYKWGLIIIFACVVEAIRQLFHFCVCAAWALCFPFALVKASAAFFTHLCRPLWFVEMGIYRVLRVWGALYFVQNRTAGCYFIVLEVIGSFTPLCVSSFYFVDCMTEIYAHFCSENVYNRTILLFSTVRMRLRFCSTEKWKIYPEWFIP